MSDQTEVEVPFKPGEQDAFADASFDQQQDTLEEAPPAPEKIREEKDKAKEVLEQIQPSAAAKQWTIGPESMQRTYTQKPLSFLGKIQWFALVGDVLDKALSGDNALSINNLFEGPVGRNTTSLTTADFREADLFVQAVGKLLSVAPSFLVDSYSIWLNVPDYEKDLFTELMRLPAEDGGMSDDTGMEIIETFLDQNYESLADFFVERLGKLQRRASKLEELRSGKDRH